MVEDTATRDAMVDLNNTDREGVAADAALDAGCLAELRALDPEGKAQLVQRVLATYLGSLGKLAAQLRVARQGADWDQVSRAAHTLKSSSASVGALGLSALCAEIERLLRAGDSAAAGPTLDRFDAEVQRVDAAVARTLATLEAAA
ncbi:MAG TPA: Hpt domain-containing protein [Burkholderiaceae bacterium]